jgi:phospholipase D
MITKVRKSKKIFEFKHSLFGIIFGISAGFGYQEYYGIGTWNSAPIETQDINVCFTPPKGCGSLIAKEIQTATKSIHMHAYGLTSNAIIHQLQEASKRGVRVKILLDSSNFTENKDISYRLKSAGIAIFEDKISGIAHNKIIIIDKTKVITGSFNFTEAADKRNAENILLVNDEKIAAFYVNNWINRKQKAKKF